MVIVETSVFTRRITELMTDDEYREFQAALIAQPDMGAIIRRSGGLRKVRWRLATRGKRGAVRVIYYWMVDDAHIRMLYVYEKNEQTDLTADQLKQLRAIVERW